MTQRIVLASNNKGKLKEFNELLSTIGFSAHPQGEFDVPEADEPFHTFVENALTKARHAARLTGLPALPTIRAYASMPWAVRPACIPPAMPASRSPMRATAKN